jgi:glycosyltransferase involved in cell wall biosynthesis
VEFTGWLAPAEVRAQMQCARCVIAPSTWLEVFGLVVAEAMGCGTPPVVYDIGGPRELLVDLPELVAPLGDVDALAAILDGLVGEGVDRLSERARSVFDASLSSVHGAASLVAAYERVVDG